MNIKMFRGFTLIELMIVVVIIAVLAAIAIPAYQGYAEQARRADAKSGLLSLQLAQEKYRANCPSYAANIGSEFKCSTSTLNHESSSPDDYYNLSINAASTASYTLTATPTGKQTGDDCGDFVVNQNGPDYSGTNANKADCWQR